MGATTIFLFLSRSQVSSTYKTAVTVSGLVTLIALYHYFRIFSSWDHAYSVVNSVVTSTGQPFNDAYRYVDLLLTVPLLVTELILVMNLPGGEGPKKTVRLASLAVVMVLLGYPGEISTVASTRWLWWCLSMIPFLLIQYELFVGLRSSIASQPENARGLVSAAALRARKKGYDILLIDRCPRLGGRAQVFERGGYRHDAGPTVITAPFLFEELFTLHGKRLEDYVRLVPLDPWYRFRFPDDSYFDYGGTLDDTLAAIRRISPGDCDGYLALVAESKKIFAIGFEELAARPFDRLGTMVALLPSLVRLGGYRSVWQFVTRHIRHPWLQRAFSVSPLLVGGNPFDTTSIYSLIHYLERKWGIHFAMGGTGALVEGMATLLREVGVQVRLNTTVSEVIVERGNAVGVLLASGERMDADVVISDADPAFLYTKMLRRSPWVPRLKIRHAQSSMGLFVLYFGTTRKFDHVAHHTIWFGDRYRELLHDIFHRHHLGSDFSLYVHRPTATDASFAPPGCDSWYVLAPVPNLRSGTDWPGIAEAYGDAILRALDDTMMPGLLSCVTERFHMTPLDFRDRYLSVDGAGFSIAPILRQSAWFRFHNRSEGIRNLFLVGAGTHPGAGLPGVLSSAKVVEQLLEGVPA